MRFEESNSQTILDEVDMLLTGGFLKPSWTVLDLIEKPYPRGVLPRLACRQWPVPSQIILCGATVPNRGLKSVEQTLRERFPRLEVWEVTTDNVFFFLKKKHSFPRSVG